MIFLCVCFILYVVEGEEDVEDSIPIFYYQQEVEFVYISKCQFHLSSPHFMLHLYPYCFYIFI